MSLNGLLQELRVEYLESFPSKVILIETLLEQRDLVAIETEFHKMKGTGRTYGVPEATLIGEAVESVCQFSFAECEPIIRLSLGLMKQIYEAYHDSSEFNLSDHTDFKQLIHRVQNLTRN